MFDANTYRERRSALLRAMGNRGVRDGAVLFLGNQESPINYVDNTYTFRQDSSFLYFAGIAVPNLGVLLNLSTGETTLFGDDITLDDEIWTGPRPSTRDLAAASGIDRVQPRAALHKELGRRTPLFFLPPYRAERRVELAELQGIPVSDVDSRASLDLIKSVVALREIKEPQEIEQMDTAADLSARMHRAVIALARPGLRESDLAARAAEEALAGGAGLAFPTIATTRGSILHNHDHGGGIADGDLFLMDAGAETNEGYAGDLTSTFPVNGKFNTWQREIYDIVLAAHRAAAETMMPGASFRQAHFAAARAIVKGLAALGLMRGDVEEAVAAGAHALFFPHGIGHQIGLDVHDMESLGEIWVGYDGQAKSAQFGLASLRMAKTLKPGMAVTVEPGLYFIRPLIEKWRAEGRHAEFIAYDRLDPYLSLGGVRNEEDWLITEKGARKLGGRFDKSPEAIEAAVGRDSL